MESDVAPETVARLGDLCAGLPRTEEQDAWRGTRWRVQGRTFAHVLAIAQGRPASYAEAAGTAGPAVVLTFRVAPGEVELFRRSGLPYFVVGWGRDLGGLVLDDATDWSEVAELVTESYCLLAPARLVTQVTQVTRPGSAGPISAPG